MNQAGIKHSCFYLLAIQILPVILLNAMITLSFAQESIDAEKYIRGKLRDKEGREITRMIVPEKPPAGFRAPAVIIPPEAVVLSPMPAYKWSFGCSPTAAAMAGAFYDKTNFPGVYTGPFNGGLMPMNNEFWGTVNINGEILNQCPLSATREGLDGRTTRGHVDDYWIMYGSNNPDPYLVNGWEQHIHGECMADFMGTSQSSNNVTDGGTMFYYYTNGDPLFDFTLYEPDNRDGCHGLRLFYESRSYSVIENYSQFIYGYNGNTGGFRFEQYMEEIDNGRPVLIQVSGHTMLGYGYYEADSTIYLHDTWDMVVHPMKWGRNYSGLQHYGVTVLRLQLENGPPVADFAGNPDTINPGQSIGFADLSSGNPFAWQWTFEGGTPSSSTEQNPVITYNTPGKYNVSLVTTNAYGYDTKSAIDFITVLHCLSSDNCEDFITRVQLSGLDNPNNICSPDGYADYTNLSSALIPGKPYSISVSTDSITAPGERCGLWIDWNQDMEFSIPAEFLELSAIPDTNLFSSSFTPPLSSSFNSPIRMRIRLTRSGELFPCGPGGPGETEDYTILLLRPEIIISQDSLDFGDVVQFQCSEPLSYMVSGNNLSSPLLITASPDMQISFSPDQGFTYALSIMPINDTVAETPVYVKFCIWLTTGDWEFIYNSSPGALQQVVHLHANMIIPLPGDAPVTTIASVLSMHDTLVNVPMTVTGFSYVQEGLLEISYNPLIMTFEGITNMHEEITWWFTDWWLVEPVSDTMVKIRIYLDGHDIPKSIPDNEKLLDLVFSYRHGVSAVEFVNDWGEWSDAWWNIMIDEPFDEFYHNGSVAPLVKSLKLKIFLECLSSDDSTQMRKARGSGGVQFPGNIADLVTIKLASTVAPYETDTIIGPLPLLQDGSCTPILPVTFAGEFYLIVTHRNSIETWSAVPVLFMDDYITYDFSESASNAYGNNLKLINNRYCIYGGDINNDGVVDTGDMTLVENDASSFATGYLITDINGDGIVDTGDMTIVDNNSGLFIMKIRP